MFYSRTVLPSGIRVLTERMPEVRSVSLGFWIGVGSRDEPAELQGASHFLEHLLFKGTATHSSREISEAFDAVGGDANGEAARDYTIFYARVLEQDLDMAVEIVADMVASAALKSEDVESERKVILEEIAAYRDSPEDLVHDVFLQAIYGSHPLGREVMGTTATVKGIEAPRLRSFYDANYRAANLVVSAAGSVDHDALASRIDAAWNVQGVATIKRDPPPNAAAARLVVVTRDTEQAHVIVGGTGYSRHHPDRFAWGTLDDLLGGGSSSRLFQEVREERGLAYTVYSYRAQFEDSGVYAIYAGTAPSRCHEVLKVIGDELDRFLATSVSEEEVERSKGRFRGGIVMGLEDPASRMGRLGRGELMHDGEILSTDEVIARVEAVTVDDVSKVARDLLRRESRVLTVIGPFAADEFAGWDGSE